MIKERNKMSEITRIECIVWHELVHSAYWEQYLSQYVSHKYDYRKAYSTVLLVLSTIGASSFSAWKLIPNGEKWVPTITFGIMAIVQLISICQKNVVIDDDTARKLRELRIKYIEYLNKIERLYLDIRDSKLDVETTKNRFFDIRESVYSIEELKDSLNIKKLRKPNIRGQYEMEVRLSRKFGIPAPTTNPYYNKWTTRVAKRISQTLRTLKLIK